MKKIITMGLMLASFQLVQAQETTQSPQELSKNKVAQKGRRGKGMQDRKAMMQELNLSEEQKTKLREMNEGNRQKKQAILSNSQLTEEQKRSQLNELRESGKGNLQQVLTDEQKAKMKDLRMKRRDKMRSDRQKKQTTSAETQPNSNL